MTTKLPKQEWFYVGLIERPCWRQNRRGRKLSYRWTNGYSTDPTGKTRHWVTRREACAQAQRDGFRASFANTNSITTSGGTP